MRRPRGAPALLTSVVAAVLAAVLSTVALGACTSEPEPVVADPTAPVTSPTTADPSPSPSESPSSAGPAPVALSPEETVRAWVAAFNRAASGRDDQTLRELSTADCLQCNQFLDGYEAIYASGGSVRTDGWAVAKLKRKPTFERTGELAALITSSGGTVVERSGAEAVEDPPRDIVMDWTLQRRGETWLVSELTVLS